MMPIFSIIYRAVCTPVKSFGLICPCLTQLLIRQTLFCPSTVNSVLCAISNTHDPHIHFIYVMPFCNTVNATTIFSILVDVKASHLTHSFNSINLGNFPFCRT